MFFHVFVPGFPLSCLTVNLEALQWLCDIAKPLRAYFLRTQSNTARCACCFEKKVYLFLYCLVVPRFATDLTLTAVRNKAGRSLFLFALTNSFQLSPRSPLH